MARVLRKSDLIDGNTFHGSRHGDANVSFIWVEVEPGDGPRLHQHAYEEIFIVLEGKAIFTVGEETVKVSAGDIVIGPANVPHTFINDGPGILRQIDIHETATILTEWLED